MADMTEPDTDTALSYEKARDELVEVVRRLEAGGTTLEESLALWERGEELARICGQWLAGARARLDAVLRAEHERDDQDTDQDNDREDDREDGAAEGEDDGRGGAAEVDRAEAAGGAGAAEDPGTRLGEPS